MKKFLCCLLALFVGLVAGADIMAQDMSKSIKLGVVAGQSENQKWYVRYQHYGG